VRKKIPHLKECPEAGAGNHTWVYYAACTLAEADFTDEEAAPIIESRMKRAPQPTEIADALNAARRVEKSPTMKWPPRDFELINLIAQEPGWTPKRPNAEAAGTLKLLFPGDPLLCIGASQSSFATERLSKWRFLDRQQFIVPSAMTARFGKTKAGHESQHSLDNTGPRMYQVVEFDWGSIERQLQTLRHLAGKCLPLKLVMVVHSGSRSAHGWFACGGIPEEQVKHFFEYAVRCGADPRLWLRSQFCRMPGGTRDDGKEQAILYLNRAYLSDRAKSFVNASE
jgi:hypothetical protein